MTAPSRAQSLAAAEVLLKDPAVRVSIARQSHVVFGKLYLGLDAPQHWLKWSRIVREAKERPGRKLIAVLAPRAHGKTEFFTRVVPECELISDRNVRVLVVSGKFEGAKKSLLSIKTDLERNKAIAADFGGGRPWHLVLVDTSNEPDERGQLGSTILRLPLSQKLRHHFREEARALKPTSRQRRDKGGPWTQRQLYVERDKVRKDPTFECVGVYGKITGGRFDAIIIDDPDDDQDTRNQTQRDRKWEWLNSSVLELLEPDGMCILIMTRKHADDTAGRCLASPLWDVVHDKAVLAWPGGIPAFETGVDGVERPVEPDRTKWRVVSEITESGREVIRSVDVESGAKVLWPEKWPIEILLRDKFLAGWTRALREQQQFVVDDEGSEIKRAWLEAARDTTLTFARDLGTPWIRQRGIDLVVQAWDPALLDDKRRAKETDSDFTVGWTVGINTSTWQRYLLRGFRDRGLSPRALRSQVRTEAARFQPLFVGFEANAFGALHTVELRASSDLPLKPHTTTGPKKTDPVEGIPRIATLFESGKYTLPYGDPEARAFVDVFTNEAHGYGTEAHDDTLLSLWILECLVGVYQAYCERCIKRGKKPPHVARREAAQIEQAEAGSNAQAVKKAQQTLTSTSAVRRRRGAA